MCDIVAEFSHVIDAKSPLWKKDMDWLLQRDAQLTCVFSSYDSDIGNQTVSFHLYHAEELRFDCFFKDIQRRVLLFTTLLISTPW